MKTTVGLWIDHRKSVIVVVSDKGEETTVIESHVEKHAGRVAGARAKPSYEAQKAQADDSRQREFTGHLNVYYDEVVAAIRDADSILIFGPGEAKGELKNRLEKANLDGRIVAMETVDRLTDPQIAAKVRDYFHK